MPQKKQEILVPFLDRTIEFISRCSVDKHRSHAVLKAVIALLGDLGQSFGLRMLPVLSQPFVQVLIQEGVNADESTKSIANYTQTVRCAGREGCSI